MKVSVGHRSPDSFTVIRFRCNLVVAMTTPNVPSKTKGDKALEISATIASAVPWIGGPVSNVLSGIAVNRRFERVEEILNGLANELKDFHLTGIIKNPGGSFDEQARFLKTLDGLEVDHVRVLRALLADPVDGPSIMGSIRQTLMRRLPGLSQDRIAELVRELDGLGLTNDLSRRLVVMMTGSGSADLKSAITPKGQQFLRFLGVH